MDAKQAGASLDSLISLFNTRIAELQQLVIARNMHPASSISDLSEIDAAVKGMELQVQNIKNRLREETRAIPKAKKLIEAALLQQKKLENISARVPSYVPGRMTSLNKDTNKSLQRQEEEEDHVLEHSKHDKEHAPKVFISGDDWCEIGMEKKSRVSQQMWYVTGDELNSIPSYMKQRLTLDKVNAAISDMATYAEANSQLMAAPRNKLLENDFDKALVLREIAMTDAMKGKHFFLETDIRGPNLKLDNSGKALLTVLRHLGRITETRIGPHRVIILMRP